MDKKPHLHALSMASASHLHGAGFIDRKTRDAIHKKASMKLARRKKKKPAMFGSLAPQSAGHYLSTMNPGAVEDQG